MNTQDFVKLSRTIAVAQAQMDELRRRAGTARLEPLLPESLDRLQDTMEELYTAQEELRQQQEVLADAHAQLEAERWRYLDLFEFAPEAYLVTSPTGVIQEANQAAAELLGLDVKFLVGKPLITYIDEPSHPAFRDTLRLAGTAAPAGPRAFDLRIAARGGRAFPAEALVVPESKPQADGGGLRWMLRDITARVEAQEALRRRHEHFRAVLENVGDIITLVNECGEITYQSPAVAAVLGYTPEERLGASVFDIVHPEDLPAATKAFAHGVRAPGYVVDLEVRVRHKDGSWRHLAILGRNLLDDPAVGAILIAARDVTPRHRLEAQVVEISSLERSRMGQDLHDGVGQVLTALGMFLGGLEGKLRAKGIAEADDAGNLKGMVAQAMAETRRIARGLHPVRSAGGDLAAMLEDLRASTETLFNIRCTLRVSAPRPLLEPDAAEHLYRIAQEAAHNAVKHGKAAEVVIRVTATESGLTQVVEDNGVGLPPEEQRKGGMGLDLMRYRARLLGAQLDLRGGPTGTTVTVALARPIALAGLEK